MEKEVKLALPKNILKESGMVILPLIKYEKLKEEIEEMRKKIREWKKREREEEKILQIIIEGEKEYRAGKLKPIKSLKELK